MTIRRYTTVTEVEDLEKYDEILETAEMIYNGWFSATDHIDWDEFIYRLDNMELSNGTRLDLGNSFVSPVIEAIKQYINEYRKM